MSPNRERGGFQLKKGQGKLGRKAGEDLLMCDPKQVEFRSVHNLKTVPGDPYCA